MRPAGSGPACRARWVRMPSVCSAAGTWLRLLARRCAGTVTVLSVHAGLVSQTVPTSRTSSPPRDGGCMDAMTDTLHRTTSTAAPTQVTVGVGPVSPSDVVAVARHGAGVRLDD